MSRCRSAAFPASGTQNLTGKGLRLKGCGRRITGFTRVESGQIGLRETRRTRRACPILSRNAPQPLLKLSVLSYRSWVLVLLSPVKATVGVRCVKRLINPCSDLRWLCILPCTTSTYLPRRNAPIARKKPVSQIFLGRSRRVDP